MLSTLSRPVPQLPKGRQTTPNLVSQGFGTPAIEIVPSTDWIEWDEVDSPESACGGVADSALIESWPLDAGSKVTVFWNNWPVHPDKSPPTLCRHVN
jgi:hypothetical protein